MRKLVLIDAHALIHRAFHALPPTLTSPQGVPTNAIFGFTSVLIKMLKDLKPDYVVSAFDLPGGTFRHEEFAEYKSQRVRAPDGLYLQIPYIKEILSKFGIPVFEKPGFEADDLIGSLAEQAKENKDLQVVIMTGDLDTLQLVEGEKVVVFTLKKGVTDTFIYNEKEVVARYGLEPSQMIDFKGLKGDPSDNIPGVPGIGEKTASALIKEFGSLEKLYEAIENPPAGGKKSKVLTPKLIEKLTTNKDQAFFSKKLTTIIREIDISFDLKDALWRENMDRAGLEKILKDLALFSLVKRIDEIDGKVEAQPKPVSLFGETDSATGKMLGSSKEIADVLETVSPKDEFVVDIQQGLIVFGHQGKSFGFPETALESKNVSQKLRQLMEDPAIRKVGHDLKLLSRWCLEHGFSPAGLSFDTKLAAYIINSDIKDFLLERLYFMEFNQDIDPEPLKRIGYILKLKALYLNKLRTLGLMEVFEKIELPLISVLAKMEMAGIKVNTQSLDELSVSVNKELKNLEKEISKMAGGEFNINSPQQLSGVLFEKLEIKGKVRKTGKGALSTAAGELEKLIDEHPIVPLILKYRELQKLKTTYIEPFPALINKKNSRVHTTYNQTGTTTGRLSSQDPNLQNIPVRTELGQEFRKSFIAERGYKLVSFDYSQLELRIAAHISGDKAMSQAFLKGEDIHTRTAAGVFNVPPEQVTKNMRRQAKVLNFGVLYGMGPLSFQRAAGVGRDEARQFIQNYMAEFAGIAKYMDETKKQAHREGYVSTIFGRRRQLLEINSGIPQLVASAERIAINMPVQGTAADLIKLAMIEAQELLDKNYGDKARMLLQVHDELLFEIKADIVSEVSKEIKSIMENAHKFDVPIVVDVKVGDNWSEMK